MNLPSVHWGDDANEDTFFSVLKGWTVNVDIKDFKRVTGLVTDMDYPYVTISDVNGRWETDIDMDEIEHVEVL